MTIAISTGVLDVLANGSSTGNRFTLPDQLDRKLYVDVNKVLEALGGKWNRAAKAHVFDEDAEPMIEQVVQTGSYQRVKQDLGQFDTPTPVVERVIDLCRIRPGARFLEPSAGVGNIAHAAVLAGADVSAVEIDPKRLNKLLTSPRAELNGTSIKAVCRDFLTIQPDGLQSPPLFDIIGMNPPFANQADIDHVLHALRFVRQGGRLVSVMSAGVLFRTNAKAQSFRTAMLALGAEFIELDQGAFAESGTMVRACIVAVTA